MTDLSDTTTLFQQAGAQFQQGHLAEAEILLQVILSIDPEHADANHLLGIIAAQRGQYDLAHRLITRAIITNPSGIYYCSLAFVLLNWRRLEASVAAYEQAIRLNPNFAEAHYNRGCALQELGRLTEAVAVYEQAIRLNPNHADALNNRGNVLRGLNRLPEAIDNYRRALALKPDHIYIFSNYVVTILRTCDRSDIVTIHQHVRERIRTNQSVDPFVALYCPTTSSEQLACARRYIKAIFPVPLEPVWRGKKYAHEKIRIAYLSADFHSHATAYLMMDLFEKHDREKYEIIGISFGPDDHSDYRHRLQQAFDSFIDVRRMDDGIVAQRICDLEVDIAVDLKGFTKDARPGILARRPAPIQVNYLGYPGTMGADFIDYIIVDPIVVPADQQTDFSERLVHLPDCYQVTDSKRYIAEHIPTRAECGLPENGIVFYCFNNNLKITPEFFDVWMRLLKAVPGSALWLLQDNERVEKNLRREAHTRGMDPDRLVFAPRINVNEHLARQRLADLFLDTLPCNAHTTASDALWAGLPVLTCSGKTFAGRVASSLLHSIGLTELVTQSLDEYEALALKLATEPTRLGDLRTKLERNRLSAPLFNTDRFRQHLEAAYTQMWEIWQRDEKPHAFSVEPTPQAD